MPTIQINPLLTQATSNTNSSDQRIVCSASSITGENYYAGDVIAYIISGGSSNGSVGHGEGSSGDRKVVVQRMDGTTIASFDLPLLTGDEQSDDGYEDPILCWASFRRHNANTRRTNEDIDEQIYGDDGRKERRMLCVLGNPTTLLIFDVLGTHLDDEDGVIGPGGQYCELLSGFPLLYA